MEYIDKEKFDKDLDIAYVKIREALIELYGKYPEDSFHFETIRKHGTDEYYRSYFTQIRPNKISFLKPLLNGNYFK
jgi:hypothetical protein